MIKNEEAYLKASLESVAPIADEILVVDTGSTDNSKTIAESFLAKFEKQSQLRSLPWKNHFSQMRNQIAEISSFDWVLFVDGDEVLDEADSKKLKAELSHTKESCFSLVQRNYSKLSNLAQMKKWTGEIPPFLPKNSGPLYYFENHMERLYKKSSGIFYEGRIHESLIPACKRKKILCQKMPWVLHHYGRLKPTQNDKLAYYLQLTKEKWKEEQENPAAWIELLMVLSELEYDEEALKAAELGARLFSDELEFLSSAIQVALRAAAYHQAEAWCQFALRLSPSSIQLKEQLGLSLLYQGKLDACEKTSVQVLETNPESFLANLSLGILYFEKKNWDQSKQHLNIALRQRPEDQFIQSALAKIDGEQQKH